MKLGAIAAGRGGSVGMSFTVPAAITLQTGSARCATASQSFSDPTRRFIVRKRNVSTFRGIPEQ